MSQPLPVYLHFHPKQHLIIEFGNTLFFHRFNWDILKKQIQDFVYEVTGDRRRVVGDQSIHGLTNHIAQKYGPQLKQQIDQIWTKFELQAIDTVRPNEELLSLLSNIRKDRSIYIWSSNSTKLIHAVLDQYQVHELFDRIISREDVSLVKPAVEGFTQLGIPDPIDRSDMVMIGAGEEDAVVADRLGIDFYMV